MIHSILVHSGFIFFIALIPPWNFPVYCLSSAKVVKITPPPTKVAASANVSCFLLSFPCHNIIWCVTPMGWLEGEMSGFEAPRQRREHRCDHWEKGAQHSEWLSGKEAAWRQGRNSPETGRRQQRIQEAEDERMLRNRKSAEWYSEETEEGGKGLAFSEQVIMGQEPWSQPAAS